MYSMPKFPINIFKKGNTFFEISKFKGKVFGSFDNYEPFPPLNVTFTTELAYPYLYSEIQRTMKEDLNISESNTIEIIKKHENNWNDFKNKVLFDLSNETYIKENEIVIYELNNYINKRFINSIKLMKNLLNQQLNMFLEKYQTYNEIIDIFNRIKEFSMIEIENINDFNEFQTNIPIIYQKNELFCDNLLNEYNNFIEKINLFIINNYKF